MNLFVTKSTHKHINIRNNILIKLAVHNRLLVEKVRRSSSPYVSISFVNFTIILNK